MKTKAKTERKMDIDYFSSWIELRRKAKRKARRQMIRVILLMASLIGGWIAINSWW